MMTLSPEYFLLTSRTMAAADKAAIQRIGSGCPLMEAAGKSVFTTIEQRYPKGKILVLCGAGNNGGDGFVAAKYLLHHGRNVHVVVLGDTQTIQGDAKTAFSTLPSEVLYSFDALNFQEYDIIIDALFGTGLDRDVKGEYKRAITHINQSNAHIISVDIPSGVNASTADVMGVAVKAGVTVTFCAPKVGHYILPAKEYAGEVLVQPIGIEPQDFANIQTPYYLNHPICWQKSFMLPQMNQHKYHRGHALIIGANMEHMGASKLAAKACLRAGAGLVSIACERNDLVIYASWATSVMTKVYDDKESFATLIHHPKISSIAIGMGAGVSANTKEKTIAILQTQKPCVIDADAIASFAGEFELLAQYVHHQAVLTPHDGEFNALFGTAIDAHANRLEKAIKAAKLLGCHVVLKGNDTVIAAPDGTAYVNYSAHSGMATAGSGDVLSGIIAAKLGLTDNILHAAASGVYAHSQAGNKYSSGMIADDIIDGLLENSIE